ncbi:MAG: histidine kinase dimerization/phospho-acceptor domain-containing protein, partial [Campylobacterales bacterium]
MFALFSKKSIRRNFLIQLIFSLASLIIIFSSMLYLYIERSIYEEKKEELIIYAKNISTNKSIPQNIIGVNIEVIYLKKTHSLDLYETTIDNKTYLTLIYPFHLTDMSYLKISRDITLTKKLLDKILHYIFIINIAGFVLVILYAITLSKMLVSPVHNISKKLSNMNEHLIEPLQVSKLPQEFEPLGITINHLILRIQNFVKYQKELFIGTAHELKTPLAVIKLKNQVTLMKKRTPEEYIEALKVTNKTVDEMNIIVSNILNIGRQEGAQLDKPVEVDVIDLLKQKANDFKLLAESEGKELMM